MSIRQTVEYWQKQFDDNADLNDEPRDVQVFSQRDRVYWMGEHKITGLVVRGRCPDPPS